MDDFSIVDTALAQANGRHARVMLGGRPVSMSAFYTYLRSSEALQSGLTWYLKTLPFHAIHWETPPICLQTQAYSMEFVSLDAPRLAGVNPDPGPFSEYFSTDEDVVDFSNQGGDAHLVAPTPPAASRNYAHLLGFVNEAPAEVTAMLWARLGTLVSHWLSQHPRWISTAGHGVSWLHVRIDTRPKYYRYAPYRQLAARDEHRLPL